MKSHIKLHLFSNKIIKNIYSIIMIGVLLTLTLITISCQRGLYTTSTYQSPITGSIQYPLHNYQIIQEFGYKRSSGRYHAAEDAMGTPGTSVYAIADGQVSYSSQMNGYGWLIIIDHPDLGVYSLYGHLSTWRFKVTDGYVVKGQLIAYIADDDEDGSGGGYPNWGPHLHFGIRQGMKDDYPSTGDNRWTAGHTYSYPSTLGWIAPSEFIK